MKMVSVGNVAVLIALVVIVEAANVRVPLHYLEPTKLNEGDRIMPDSCIIIITVLCKYLLYIYIIYHCFNPTQLPQFHASFFFIK